MENGNGKTDNIIAEQLQPTGTFSGFFISPTRGRRDFSQVVNDILEFIEEDKNSRYVIGVGTDSEGLMQNNDPELAGFVTVITVHRVGKYGRFFWRGMRHAIYNRHDRILKEAHFSLELARYLIAELRRKISDDSYDFEIHLDIGKNGPTQGMIQEIVGMVTGSGFVAKIKPDSYAANKVADRYV